MNVEEEFSERRGRKMLPIAINTYTANLPEFYTTAHHTSQLNHAVHLLKTRVRSYKVICVSCAEEKILCSPVGWRLPLVLESENEGGAAPDNCSQ